ncbi:hypothetical protein N182_38050 [Sinorhizobium sp. GL2]|nr:hypothetical protein N182_38050 [Sinorhizobium sp. GL2]
MELRRLNGHGLWFIFIWPSAADGTVVITPAQLGYLLEGINWRMPQKTLRPTSAG